MPNLVRQHFTRFMLTNPAVTTKDALKFLAKLTENHTETDLNVLLIEINRLIQENGFKIVKTTCEVTGKPMLIWINLKNDAVSRLQESLTLIECQYFQTILQEILGAEDHVILYPRAINISSTLTASYSRSEASKILEEWFRAGYYTKKGNEVLLGPRTIVEFATYLKNNTESCICDLCTELVFKGSTCQNCEKSFHNHCLEQFMQSNTNCPNCKNVWDAEAGVDTEDNDSINSQSC